MLNDKKYENYSKWVLSLSYKNREQVVDECFKLYNQCEELKSGLVELRDMIKQYIINKENLLTIEELRKKFDD